MSVLKIRTSLHLPNSGSIPAVIVNVLGAVKEVVSGKIEFWRYTFTENELLRNVKAPDNLLVVHAVPGSTLGYRPIGPSGLHVFFFANASNWLARAAPPPKTTFLPT